MQIALQDGKVVVSTLDGVTRASCQCCSPLQFSYTLNPFDYGALQQCVSAFGGGDGLCCEQFPAWPYVSVFDEPPTAGEVYVSQAKSAGLWTSTSNIYFYAIWDGDSDQGYQPYPGGTLEVTYLGDTKSLPVSSMVESQNCGDIGLVATVMVSATDVGDGTFFTIS
jgi:hypothetical protein